MRNLMMARKSVAPHCEDVVPFAVNAAEPIVDAPSDEEGDGGRGTRFGARDFTRDLDRFPQDGGASR
ncbi:hypothetical protein [Streptomyces sp. NPDC002851]